MTLNPFWEGRRRSKYRKPNGSHQRKTVKGSPILTMDEFISMVDWGHYFYLEDKVIHPAIIASMQFRTILRLLGRKQLYRALDIETGEPYLSRTTYADSQG